MFFRNDTGKWKRNKYPLDKIKAENNSSSFDYSGRVTDDINGDRNRVVRIDNTVVYETVSNELREEAQANLNYIKKTTYFAGFLGLSGLGYSAYKITDGYIMSGLAGALGNFFL